MDDWAVINYRELLVSFLLKKKGGGIEWGMGVGVNKALPLMFF